MLKKGVKLIRKKADYKKFETDLNKLNKQNEKDFARKQNNDEMDVDNPNLYEESKDEDNIE